VGVGHSPSESAALHIHPGYRAGQKLGAPRFEFLARFRWKFCASEFDIHLPDAFFSYPAHLFEAILLRLKLPQFVVDFLDARLLYEQPVLEQLKPQFAQLRNNVLQPCHVRTHSPDRRLRHGCCQYL
jgi:hypothetical protein